MITPEKIKFEVKFYKERKLRAMLTDVKIIMEGLDALLEFGYWDIRDNAVYCDPTVRYKRINIPDDTWIIVYYPILRSIYILHKVNGEAYIYNNIDNVPSYVIRSINLTGLFSGRRGK